MNTKFTPGPWSVIPEVLYQGNHVAGRMPAVTKNGDVIARVNRSPNAPLSGRCEESEANARLIAAAPELLAALEGVLRVADRATDEFDAARAAIAKAKGEA